MEEDRLEELLERIGWIGELEQAIKEEPKQEFPPDPETILPSIY